jgi:hypothetical protein
MLRSHQYRQHSTCSYHTSGDPSPAAGGGNHFFCADTESERPEIYSDDNGQTHYRRLRCGGSLDAEFTRPILASLDTEFTGNCPHGTLRGYDSGRRKACGVRRWFLHVVWGSSFQRCGEARRRTTVTGVGRHMKTGRMKLSYYSSIEEII